MTGSLLVKILVVGGIGLIYMLMIAANTYIQAERRDARRRAERHFVRLPHRGALTRHIR